MRRTKIMLFLVCLLSFVFLTAFTEEFYLVFDKVGVSRFYFTDPDTKTLKRDALEFPLSPDSSGNYETSVGVHWDLYPSSASTEKLSLKLEFSAENNIDSGEKWMLQKDAANGFNYDAVVRFIRSGTASINNGSTEEKLNQERRTLTLYEDPVSSRGTTGDATVTLSVNKDIDTGDGTYRGYLIMSLESN